MGIGTRLSTLMDINDTNANELAKKIGVSPQTIYSIIKRDSKKADIEVLLKIADIFGVTAEYFVSENTSTVSTNEIYSKKDFEHLKAYCSLDSFGKSHVDAVLTWETDRMEQLKEKSDLIMELENRTAAQKRIWAYYGKIACAGSGFIFDDIPTDTIEAPYIDGADFIIGVSGDSMEPDYHDGEKLYVKKTDHINLGEVGIFTIRNECFLKEYGENGLVSRNSKYKDIPGDEDVRLIGKVVGQVEE